MAVGHAEQPAEPGAQHDAHVAAGKCACGSSSSSSGGTTQAQVGFQPNYAAEGKFEALEFAAGNYGLLESAYEYAFDTSRRTCG